MASVVADTHALLWMLRGTLRERSPSGADAIDQALIAKTLHVSIGSFLDLRYLVDSGRLADQAFDDARSIVDGDAFVVVPLDLRVLDKMAAVPREKVPDPFDRIIAATALTLDLPLVSADEDIQGAIGERVIW
ncbi:MAG: PIN domain-containing protein [Pantoea agglomerans]